MIDDYNEQTQINGKKQKRGGVHPIWRGIGCVLIILIPVVAYACSILVMNANFTYHWIPVSKEFAAPPEYPYLYARLLVTAILSIGLYTLLTIFYLGVYRTFGPARYGPLDAPPPRKKAKKYRR